MTRDHELDSTGPLPRISLQFDAETRNYTDPRPLNAFTIHDMIVESARHQVANSEAGKAIRAAGLEHEINSLLVQIAANAANPIADLIADALIAQARIP